MAYLQQIKRDIQDLIPGESIRVDFSRLEEDRKQLRKLLRDSMYSDTYAFIREIASNTYDACVETNTIGQVILKRASVEDVDDKLIFKDFGNGMSRDFMTNEFSQIGRSSKRDNPDVIGSRGLGRLSPLKYTDSFYIITRNQGTEYMWLVFHNEEDDVSLKLIYEKPSKDVGTEVVITLRNDVNKIIEELQDKLEFLKIERIGWENQKRDIIFESELGLITKQYRRGVILGGLFYPYNIVVNGTFSAILKFDIGELDLPATREYLENTQSNLRKIDERRALFEKQCNDFFKQDIEKESDVISRYVKSLDYKMKLENPLTNKNVSFYRIGRRDEKKTIDIKVFAEGKIKMAGSELELSRIRTYLNNNPNVNEVYFIKISDEEYNKLNLNYLRVKDYDKTIYTKSKVTTDVWGSLNGSSRSWVTLYPSRNYVYSLLDSSNKLNEIYRLSKVECYELPKFDSIALGKSRIGYLPSNCIPLDVYLETNKDKIKRLVGIKEAYTSLRKFENDFWNKACKIKEYVVLKDKILKYLNWDGTPVYETWHYEVEEDSFLESMLNDIERLSEKYNLLKYLNVPRGLEHFEDELIKFINEKDTRLSTEQAEQ